MNVRLTQLDKLQKGASGIIIGFAKDGRITRRLMELGLVPGRKVTFLRAAPLRDPMQVKIGESRLSIRKTEASLIEIELQERELSEE